MDNDDDDKQTDRERRNAYVNRIEQQIEYIIALHTVCVPRAYFFLIRSVSIKYYNVL